MLGSRDVARGHLYHTHSRHRSRSYPRSLINQTITNLHPHHGNYHHNHSYLYNHQRQRHLPPQSPTSSSLTENEAPPSPGTSQTSRIHSRGSPSPGSSRLATPSPPAILPSSRPTRRFPRLPLRASRNYFKRLFSCKAKGSARIDVIARFAFPLMFILFNFGYWSMYLFREDDTVKVS